MDPREFPTKGNLIAAKNSLTLAKQGYDLMDKKRNILIRELMDLIDEAKDIQEEIDTTFTRAYACLQRANIQHGISKVEELAYTVPIEDSIQIQTRSIMGTEIPQAALISAPISLLMVTFTRFFSSIFLNSITDFGIDCLKSRSLIGLTGIRFT